MLACRVGLKLGTEYEMLVVAINAHGENEIKMKSIKAMTSGWHFQWTGGKTGAVRGSDECGVLNYVICPTVRSAYR